VRRERFVFVGRSGLLLLPTAYLAVGGWFTVSTPSNASGYRKTNWMYGCGHSQVQVDQNPVVVGTRKSKWIRIPWLWVLASSTPMLLTRRIRWVWVLAESDGYGYSQNPMGMGTRTFNWIYGCGHSLLLLWRPDSLGIFLPTSSLWLCCTVSFRSRFQSPSFCWISSRVGYRP